MSEGGDRYTREELLRQRPFLTPFLDRLGLGWRLVLDALLIVLALFLRNFVMWAVVETGGEGWEVTIVRVITNVSFVLGSLALLISDFHREIRLIQSDTSDRRDGTT